MITMSAPLQYSFNPPSGSRTERKNKTSIDNLSRKEADMGELDISEKKSEVTVNDYKK